MNVIQAAEELLRRRKALECPLAYIEYMAPCGLKYFQMQKIIPYQEKIISALVKVETGEDPQLMLSMPPGGGKTQICSVIFVTWWLAKHPDRNVLCISNAQDVADEFAGMRRKVFETKEWQLLSQTALDPAQKSYKKQGFLAGGHCYTFSITSAIDGIRADLVVGDDCVRGDKAQSRKIMDDYFDKWVTSIEPRLESSPFRQKLVVGTRWSSIDLHQKILDREDNIRRRAEEDGTPYRHWVNLKFPFYCTDEKSDQLGRKLGEPINDLGIIWDRSSIKDIELEKPMTFKCEYQQEPAVEKGEWASRKHFHILDHMPRGQHYVCGIDMAIEAGDGDFTVFVVASINHEKQVTIVDVVRRQMSPDFATEIFFGLHQKYGFKQCFIDDDNASKMWLHMLQDPARRTKIVPPVRKVKMSNQNKEIRNAPFRVALINDHVRFMRSHWNEVCFKEMENFPFGAHDDFIDAAGLIFTEINTIPLPKHPTAMMREDLKTQVVGHGSGFAVAASLDEMFRDRESSGPRNKLRI